MNEVVELLGPFPDATTLDRVLDRRMFCSSVRTLLPLEPRLARAKWFDYRFMHVGRSAAYWAHIYREVYRRMTERHFSRSKAPWTKGIKGEIWQSKMLVAIWRARQFADALCMPYGLYIELAMTIALRREKRDHPPLPAELYGDAMIDELQAMWLDRRRSRVFVAKHPAYRLDAFVGNPDQLVHQDWLIDQAQLRERPELLLGRYLYQEPMLHEERVVARFGSNMPARAKRAVS